VSEVEHTSSDASGEALAGGLSSARGLEELIELTVLLSGVLDEHEVAVLAASHGAAALGASAAFVAVSDETGSGLDMLAHVRGGEEVRRCRLQADQRLPVVDAWRTALPVLLHTPEEIEARCPALDPGREARCALAALPLHVDGAAIGALNLTFATPQGFDAQQLALMTAFAQLCAQAIRRGRLTHAVERLRHDFVMTASHELRTPTAAIYGLAVTLQRSEIALSPESREELIGMIASQAERMARVIEDLRLTGELEAGAPHLHIESVDLQPVVQEATSRWSQVPADARRLSVELNGAPAVRADPVRLQQVLASLLDNAFKYSPAGSPVTLRAVPAGTNDIVRLAVQDQGPGLDEHARVRVFEKFVREDAMHRNGVSGAGLGLFLSRRLVTAMGGRLWLEDGPAGRGLAACLELPAA